MQTPYLTITQLAVELDISIAEAHALIERGKLPAVNWRDGSKRVSRLALESYLRRAAGEAPKIPPIKYSNKSPAERRAEFEAQTGMSPAEWMQRWEADEIEDSAENMRLSIDADVLASYERGER